MIYNIYTEDKNRVTLLNLISDRFPSFTLFEAQGYWKGNSEATLVIQIIARAKAKPSIYRLAREIATVNDQEAVLVITTTARSSKFIGPIK